MVLRLLERKKDRPGDFFARGVFAEPSPGLEIEQVIAAQVSLPVITIEMPLGWGPGGDDELRTLLSDLAEKLRGF